MKKQFTNKARYLGLKLTAIVFALLLFVSGQSWGQSYLGLDGGFEGAATIDNTVQTSAQANKWVKNNASQTIADETTIVRSGGHSLSANNGTTGRRIWSPLITVSSTTSQVTIQYYRRVTNTTNTQETQHAIGNGTTTGEGLSGSYTSNPTANTWEKVTYTRGSWTYTNISGAVLHRQIGTGGSIYIDDVAMYAGAVDNSAPNSPGTVAVVQNGSNPTTKLDVSWGAATGGYDNGGYFVVRYATAAPVAADDPNVNGIYKVGNTITVTNTGTVVYVGTSTSFTDDNNGAGLTPGATYYYKVYTYDKAYNYSAEFSNTGTSGATAIGSGPSLIITGSTAHGSVCPNTSAGSIQYTITNNGPVQADGISVNSDNAQFVVSNLSSTSIAATNGTATYDVTFTPSSAGAKTATITVTSSTSGSNSPTSSLSGTGTATIAQAVTSSAASTVSYFSATLNGNITTLGVCPATIEKGFVYSLTSANNNPQNGGTGVTKTSVAGISTGAYTLGLTGLTSNTGYSFNSYVYDGTTYTYGTVRPFTTTNALAISGTTSHGSICPTFSATPITYTITNNSLVQADGINVVSSDPQFVVSGLSSTTLTAPGGTVTYQVTFTPTSSGAKSSTITVTSSTSEINSPTSSLTGTGTTPVTQAITSSAATSVSGTKATLNGNITTLGVCPASTEKGFVYALTATNNDPLVDGTGVTKTVVSGVATGVYNLALTSLTPETGYSFKAYVYNGTTYTYGSVTTFTTLALADHLGFGTAPPATGNVGANLTTFTVRALRPDNTVDIEYTTNITIAKASGSGILSGTLSPAAVAGVATYSDAQFDITDTYTITATSGSLTSVTSNNIVINPSSSTSDYFRSKATGNWGSTSTWESSTDNSTWFAATLTPTSAANSITILGHTVTVAVSVSAADQLTINSGGQITVSSGQTLTIANGVGTDLTITGTLLNSGSIILQGTTSTIVDGTFTNSGSLTLSTGSTSITVNGIFAQTVATAISNSASGPITFASGSEYRHQPNGGTIPTATWAATSTCNVTGMIGTTPSGLGQTFGNFIWNCTGQTAFAIIGASGNFNPKGLFTCASTGTNVVELESAGSGSTYNFDGGLTISGGKFVVNYDNASAALEATLNINGNLEVSGTGIFDIAQGACSATTSGYLASVNLSGNITVSSSASYPITTTASNNFSRIYFTTGSSHNYSRTSSLASRYVDFIVSSGNTLNLINSLQLFSSSSTVYDELIVNGILNCNGNSIIQSSGTQARFTINSGATLITANATGITGSITVGGTKTFSSAANYEFQGAATGTFTTTPTANTVNNLTINNASGVTLGQSLTVSGTTSLTSGTLTVGSNTLTINGSTIIRDGVSYTGNIDASNSSATLTFTNTSAINIPANTFTGNLNNLTINGVGGITFNSDRTVAGTLTLTSGALSIGTTVLTLNGSISIASGTVDFSNGTVVFNQTANTTIPWISFKNLDIYNTGVKTLSANTTITGTLSVYDGVLDAGNYQITGVGNLDITSFGGTIKTALAGGLNEMNQTSGGSSLYDVTANYTFNGSSAQVTGSLLPATVNNLTIDNAAGVTLSNSALTVNGTLLINSGKKLEIGVDKQLTVSGTLTNSAGSTGLVLKSDATGTASLIHSTASVPAIVERYIPKNDTWHFLSSPIASQTIIGNFAPSTCDQTFDFFKWDETADMNNGNPWINLRESANLYNIDFETGFAVGSGYLVAYSSGYNGSENKFVGNLNSGNQTIAITKNLNTFNLIGNPFASAINWDATGYTNRDNTILENAEPSIWSWNGTSGNYGTYKKNVTGTNGVTNIIAPHQGFFVQAKAAGSFTIPNTSRVHSNSNILKSTPSELLRLKVSSTANTFSDEVIVNFNSNATANEGVSKWYSMVSAAPSLFTVKNSKNLSINTLPAISNNLIVPLGFIAGVNGNYSITASELNSFAVNTYIYLKDLKTNTIQDLNQNSAYSFAGLTTDNANRFQLIFSLSPLGISNNEIQNTNVYSYNNTIYVNSNEAIKQIAVYNTLGQLIKTIANTNNQNNIDMNGNASGYYIVKVVTNKNVYSEKVLVK